MNIDLIVAYLIFILIIVFSVWYVFNIIPEFNRNYNVEISKYEEGISVFNLNGNYEVKTYLKCIKLPGYFKYKNFELNGRYVTSNTPIEFDGYIELSNGTIQRSFISSPSNGYLYADKVCPDLLIKDEKNGTETKNLVESEKIFWEGNYEFEEDIYKWY